MAVRTSLNFISIWFLTGFINFAWSAESGRGIGFIGCFVEDKSSRHFDTSPGTYDPLTLDPETCMLGCGEVEMKYAALSAGRFCFCSEREPPQASLRSTNCTIDCSGNPQKKCGDIDHVSVYNAALEIRGLGISVVTSGVLTARQPVEFEIRVDPGVIVEYQMDYGDGGLRTGANSSSITKHEFLIPGEHHVTLFASGKSGSAPETQEMTSVTIDLPVTDVVLDCPLVAATFDEMECKINITDGTSLTLDVDFGDGTNSNLSIIDVPRYGAGIPVPQHDLQNITAATDGLYVLRSAEFDKDGVVVGWELHTENIGTIELLVLTPKCMPCFCFSDNKCCTTACERGETHTCENAKTFCLANSHCVDMGTACLQTSRYSNQLDYVVKKKQTFQIIQANYNYIPLNTTVDMVNVTAGDIIGYVSTSGQAMISVSVPGSVPTSYLNGVSATVSSEGSVLLANSLVSKSDKLHFLRAVVSQKSIGSLIHTYRRVGSMMVNAKVSSNKKEKTERVSALIFVMMGIDQIEINASSFGAANKDITFSVFSHTGDNVTYTWNFGDGFSTNTTERSITHVYSSTSTYNVSVLAYNLLSSKQNSTEITIQEAIENLVVTSQPVPTGQQATIWLNMTSGSHFFCDWNLGDGTTFYSTSANTPISGTVLTHTYAGEGLYPVVVRCKNNVTDVSATATQTVIDPIVDLQLVKTGVLIDEPIFVNFTITTGTNATFVLHFDQKLMKIHYDEQTKHGHTERQDGLGLSLHSVVIRAENAVSNVTLVKNFTVDIKIKNPKITASTEKISARSSVEFTASVDNGTSVSVQWLYGDGFNDTFKAAPLEIWTRKSQARSHTFNSAGNFTIIISIYNGYDNYTFTRNLLVIAPIENLTLTSNTPMEFSPPADAYFSIGLSFGQKPVAASVAFDYGDDKKSRDHFELDQTFHHIYMESGLFNVTANVSNELGFLMLSTMVNVVEPVKKMEITTEPKHSSINKPVTVTVGMYRGGKDLTLHWDFGDGTKESGKRQGVSPDGKDSKMHVYKALGKYHIVVLAVNLLGNVSATYDIVCQNPVEDAVVLTTTAPLLFPSVEVQVWMRYDNTLPEPTDAEIIWNFNDSSVERQDFSFISSKKHTYRTDGHYITKITISNLASEMVFEITTGVYKSISGLTVIPKYKPKIPINAKDEEGFGLLKTIFPNEEVRFYSNAAGTLVWYTLYMLNSTEIFVCNSTKNPLVHKFPRVGHYNLIMTVSNPLSSASFNLTVKILDQIRDLTISDRGEVTKAKEIKTFYLTFLSAGSDSKMKLDYGDGTNDEQNVSTNISLTHTYKLSGTYTFSVTVSNLVSSKFEKLTFAVSNLKCSSPIIDIKNKKPHFWDPQKVKRSEQLLVTGRTNISCAMSIDNKKEWTVEKINYTSGTFEELINISGIKSHQFAKLALPPRFLEYGLYRIKYKVSMLSEKIPKEISFSSSAFTYVSIEKSALIGIMEKGGISEILLGYKQPITLLPQNYSYDPDIERKDDQKFSSFTWFCRDIDERYPTYPSGSLEVRNNYSNSGGCFGNGPGKINFSKGKVTLKNTSMLINHTYEVMVVIEKDTRRAKAKIDLKIVAGTTARATIECTSGKLCIQKAEGQLINPSLRLGLRAFCDPPCGTNLTIFSWRMYIFEYRWIWQEIQDFSTSVEGVSGVSSTEYLAIHASIFEKFPNITNFRVKVSMQTKDVLAEASMNLTVNRPPAGGTCSVDPLNGIVSKNTWTIDCKDWTDNNGVAEYIFYVKFSGNNQIMPVYFGSDSRATVSLPLGPIYDEHKMNLSAKIIDSLGSSTIYHIGVVQVNPMGREELETLVKQLNSDGIDEIKRIAANGDLQKTNNVFSQYASALNSASKRDGKEHHYRNMDNSPTGYGKDYEYRIKEIHERKEDTENDTLWEEKYQDERNERAKARTTMIKSLENITVATMSAITLTATTLNGLCMYPEECGRIAQKSVTRNIFSMTETFKDFANDTPKEELEVAAGALYSSVGQMFESYTNQIEDPVKMDVEAAANNMEYDTNLESEEEKITALDASTGYEQLMRITNKEEQKRAGKSMTETMMSSFNGITEMLVNSLVPGEKAINLVTPKLTMSIRRSSASLLKKTENLTQGRVNIELPDWCSITNFPGDKCDEEKIISLEVATTPSTIYPSKLNPDLISQRSSMVSMRISSDGGPMEISNSSKPFVLFIPRDVITEKPEKKLIAPFIPPRPWEHLFYHSFYVNRTNISIHIEIIPENPSVQFLCFIRYKHYPNITTRKWNYMQTIPTSMNITDGPDKSNPNIFFVDNEQIGNKTGKYYLGLRQLDPSVHNVFKDNNTITSPELLTGNFTTNYTLRIFFSSCAYYSKSKGDWSTEGCLGRVLQSSVAHLGDGDIKVGSLTSLESTQCLCTHLTLFSSGMVVAPNSIDWNFVFANMDFLRNPTLYSTEIVICLIYILAALWARRQDKKDVEKVGLTPLKDNDPNDKYLYEIIVVTGMRRNAGTDSKVYFILSGEYDETDVRSLCDDKRKMLRRGNVDSFLMATPRPLGTLTYARIWHDNSGSGRMASWHLKYFLVRDIQTGQKSYFICNRWLAVEEDDGQVDRIIPVAGKEQLTNFSHLFSQRARKNLGDGHLWFSVVARPPNSRFTRLQRVSCCLCLLFLTMLTNAMFYNRLPDGPTSNALTFGPFSLTPEQIYVGFITNLIVFPINFIIIFLFRKSKPREQRPSKIEQALKRSTDEGATSVDDIKPMVDSADWGNLHSSSSATMNGNEAPSYDAIFMTAQSKRPNTTMSRPYTPVIKKPPLKKKRFQLPWWGVIIAWIFLWIAVIVSVSFVTFYGIMFADAKCKKWITSMLVSFFMSVFITQPVKVFLTAILLSLIIKNPGGEEDEEEEEETIDLKNDEEFLHSMDGAGYGAARPKKIAYKPPDPSILENARAKRLNEIKMWEVIREIVIYSFFLWILMVISYRNRSGHSYLFKKELENTFILYNNSFMGFMKIRNTPAFWKWAKNVLVSGIRAAKYYNNAPPLLLRGFINDKVSRIMGYGTMRQLRVKRGTCHVTDAIKNLFSECNDGYSILSEDQERYSKEWKFFNDSTNEQPLEYQYTSASALDSFPYWGKLGVYSGGGYVAKLRGSSSTLTKLMERLHSENWIDKTTRAVFIEFTVYNPQVNLFGIAMLLLEWTPAGGVIPSYRFEPAMLLPYLTNAVALQLGCEIAFVVFVVYFIVKEVRRMLKLKKRYLIEFWNLVEVSLVCLSVGGIVIYFYRLFVINRLTSIFRETKGNDYMKFQYVGFWNEVFGYIIGWIVFLATLKFLKLLRFNRRMSLLASTLKVSAPSMMSFSFVYWIVFLAFAQLFFIIYMKTIQIYSNFLTAVESGFLMMMGKFDFYKMRMTQPILTPLFFFLFVMSITFILINMFLSILNETFTEVRANINKQSNDYEIVSFMVDRFKMWTGLGEINPKVAAESDLLNNRKSNPENSNADGQIDRFPDKIDRLLTSISSVYIERDNLDVLLRNRSESGKMAMKSMMRPGPTHEQVNDTSLELTKVDAN